MAEATVQSGASRKRRSRGLSEKGLAFWMVSPSMVLIALVAAYPIIYAVWLSLHEYSVRQAGLSRWAGPFGLRNYSNALQNSEPATKPSPHQNTADPRALPLEGVPLESADSPVDTVAGQSFCLLLAMKPRCARCESAAVSGSMPVSPATPQPRAAAGPNGPAVLHGIPSPWRFE